MAAVDRPAATMLSIWCRTAMAVEAFDWATERSVHEGHRTSASIAGGALRRRLGRAVEDAAADHQRDGQHDERERRPAPTAAARDGRSAIGRAGLAPPCGRREERVEVLLRRRALEHAVTRPAGSMTKVVGGAVTP